MDQALPHTHTAPTPRARSRRRLIALFAATLVVAFLGLFLLLTLFSGWNHEVTDVRRYPETLAEWAPTGLVTHFPNPIPPQATVVRFSAFPGFLQGGAHIQLRMQLPPDEVRRIESGTKDLTAHVYVGGGFFDHYNLDQGNAVPTTPYHTADDPATTFAFPDHYRLYVLTAQDRGGWNHGRTSGIALSTTANEVIYWAQDW